MNLGTHRPAAPWRTWCIVLLVSGCATTSISLRPGPRSFTAQDYERIYDAWTRDAEAFAVGNLSDVLHATATFQSWEFRHAYGVRYAADFALQTKAREAMLEASLQDAEDRHRFLVTMAGRRFRESDLT
ncbi:MAG: hypothetical protein KC416_17275, partial [Myxococcales bacterium]|nr:hypothetical protein [Myxococcales bacterium]